MIIEKAKCGGYVAHYHGMHTYSATRWEAIIEMYSALCKCKGIA